MATRFPAYPLVTCDPFFSVWSFTDELNSGTTKHWTGKEAGLTGDVTVNGKSYRFMGAPEGHCVLPQTSVTVTPHRTVYCFENDVLRLSVEFFTPWLFNRLYTVTMPASYISYTVQTECSDFSLTLTLGAELVCTGEVTAGSTDTSAYIGAAVQKPLSECGDDITVKWGYLHIAHPNAGVGNGVIYAVSDKKTDTFTLGYDSIKALSLLGKPLDEYYRTKYPDFSAMLKDTAGMYGVYLREALEFDEELLSEASRYGEDYVMLVCAACRQSVGAHKLAVSDGKPIFASKECCSDGDAATLDVTYPSIPLFLKYAPQLVCAMLRPLFMFAGTDLWKYAFAPHDCGLFPLLDAQDYGKNPDGSYDFDRQMPVEECGNAIISVAAAAFVSGDRSFADEYRELLGKWAAYLLANGYCPENQLCTDDFAGHLAKNCNLSLKTIMALACFGRLYADDKYSRVAEKMASDWLRDCTDESGSFLTFEKAGWSLKYNVVWDKIFGFGLFPESFYRNEIATYRSHSEKYGTPLDNRAMYTKLDWLVWTTVMGDCSYAREVFSKICAMLNDSESRVPLTDWYDTQTAKHIYFRNRTVVGGVILPLL